MYTSLQSFRVFTFYFFIRFVLFNIIFLNFLFTSAVFDESVLKLYKDINIENLEQLEDLYIKIWSKIDLMQAIDMKEEQKAAFLEYLLNDIVFLYCSTFKYLGKIKRELEDKLSKNIDKNIDNNIDIDDKTKRSRSDDLKVDYIGSLCGGLKSAFDDVYKNMNSPLVTTTCVLLNQISEKINKLDN